MTLGVTYLLVQIISFHLAYLRKFILILLSKIFSFELSLLHIFSCLSATVFSAWYPTEPTKITTGATTAAFLAALMIHWYIMIC